MINVEIIRSNRRSIAIEIKPDLTVIVRAPLRMPMQDIDRFIEEKRWWIEKHIAEIEERGGQMVEPKFTSEEISELADKALAYIPGRVKHFASIMGVTYSRITIRNQKTRWGSCSAKGGLNFNCLLMLAPTEVIDYVIVHELCHRKEMNHSKRFWSEVSSVLPDYKKQEKWLKTDGHRLMGRLR